MATVRMSEAEVAWDFYAVLAKAKQGVDVVIEQDHRPVAVIRAQNDGGRSITEILRDARERNCAVTLDEGFGSDLGEIVGLHQTPWNPPSRD